MSTRLNRIHFDQPPYRLAASRVFDELSSSKRGLSQTQAHGRLEKFGPNRLQRIQTDSILSKLFRQFKDLMILLLIVSAGISLYLGDRRTAGILAALVLLNALIGFFQEFKAERTMRSLEKLVIPEAKVVRSKQLLLIHSSQVVPGDIVYIEQGDSVPADLRLFDESELATNDFALTGESNPSRKFTHAISGHAELGDRHNLVFMGTTVATGHGYGITVATGMHTELGKIAGLSQTAKPPLSPLQLEINHLARRITQGTLLLCAILVYIALEANLGLRDAFLFAIGIAAAMIPQGLPAEINANLAQAASKLTKARALVKKLSAVETLGATSIICTDKTGTLTKNEMTVQQFWLGGKVYQVTGNGYQARGSITDAQGKVISTRKLKSLATFFVTGVFASNARINPPNDQHDNWYCLGDPTEGALITLASKAGINPETLDETWPERREFAFDSIRKRMSSIRDYNHHLHVFAKGSPEAILEASTHIWRDGKVKRLTKQARQQILKQHNEWADNAMRNLALAYKKLPRGAHIHSITMDEAESGLVFFGLVSMADPLREDVTKAMRDARAAHIKISIITGDYAPTARAIAVKAGLAAKPKDLVLLTGLELRDLPDEKVVELVAKGGVIFSRVSPEDKLRIVRLVKEAGHVVAVTGDGINDAPALKTANIGVAMGRTGTDVAKDSAEIILLDDSFSTLVSAIRQGRVIFQNITKATLSCLTSNAGELVTVLISLALASLYQIPLAITPVLILAIDLVAELLPIAALGWDNSERQLMNKAPRNPKHHILGWRTIITLAFSGIVMGGLAYANYLFFFARTNIEPQGLSIDSVLYAQATTLTYLTIVLCQYANILSRRVQGSVISRFTLTNRRLWLAFGVSLICVLAIIYSPVVGRYFGTVSLDATDWLSALVAAGLFLSAQEYGKYLHARLKQARTTT